MRLTAPSALLFGLIGGFVLSMSCGPAACSERNCAGCCTTDDRCLSGAVAGACGLPGKACQICATTQVCFAGACTGPGGAAGGGGKGGGSGAGGGGKGGGIGTAGGGGRAGGTGGGGGGGTAGGGATGGAGGVNPCAQIASITTNAGGQYADDTNNPPFAVMDAFLSIPGTMGHVSELIFEYYYPRTMFPSAPRTAMLTASTFGECEDCVMFFEDCTSGTGGCAHNYFAVSGNFTVTAQTQDAGMGRFTGSASNLHFVEWDYNQDIEIPGGRCLDVASVTFDARWP